MALTREKYIIGNLKLWQSGNWVSYEAKGIVYLRIHIDQLSITADDKILETLNMRTALKGVYKDDIFILIISEDSQIRKIKFQIKMNTVQVLKVLGQHFPINKYESKRSRRTTKYRDIDEHFRSALNNMENGNLNLGIPEGYKDFVKLVLLDPTFPQLVMETENILKTEGFINNQETD